MIARAGTRACAGADAGAGVLPGERRPARRTGRPLASLLLLAGTALGFAAAARGAPWIAPHDADRAAAAPDEYAWRLFIALDWPADLERRAADRAARLGAHRPVVWETWQNAQDVYLEDGADPGPWRESGGPSTPAEARRFESGSLKDLPNLRHIVAGRMVPVVDALASARRLTEIRMNRAAYEYIRAHELYNLDGQLRAVAHEGVHFPQAATEVKAKWRPIGVEEQPRYHTIEVRFSDGSVRLYGLTALHIVSKILPQWLWATFEHVDNRTLPDGEGWQLPSSDPFACGRATPACERAPRGLGLEGTVWENYRLRGTQIRFVDAANRPLRLANSELEAGLQQSSSCITCHARAALGVRAGVVLRPQIFDMRPTGGEDDALARRGYIGAPQAEWFQDPTAGAAAPPLFQSLDFVWSLAKAQRRNSS